MKRSLNKRKVDLRYASAMYVHYITNLVDVNEIQLAKEFTAYEDH